MGWNLIIEFLVLTACISGAIIFILYLVMFKSTDGHIQRLNIAAEAARRKEGELNQKIKEADAELTKRRKELDGIEKKMRQDLEEQTNKQKEELINKARSEAEVIITNAQKASAQIRRDVEKAMEIRIVDYSAQITADILSDKVKEVLDKYLIAEFIEKLNKVDMSRISLDIKVADVISATPVPETLLAEISRVFRAKLSREIKLNPKIDPMVVGGVNIMFESLQLDGSLGFLIRESAHALKQKVEQQYTNG